MACSVIFFFPSVGPASFKGNSEHALPGTCVNSIADFQGAVCNLL